MMYPIVTSSGNQNSSPVRTNFPLLEWNSKSILLVRYFSSRPDLKYVHQAIKDRECSFASHSTALIRTQNYFKKRDLRGKWCHFESHRARNTKARASSGEPELRHILRRKMKISSTWLCHGGHNATSSSSSYLWIVQVPNIYWTCRGRLPQVNRSVGTLRQQQLGETSYVNVIVIVKVAPPSVISIFTPKDFSPKIVVINGLTICEIAKKCRTLHSFCRLKTLENDSPNNWQ